MLPELTRPLVFFDIESTGLIIGKDRIIQISFIKVFPDGRKEPWDIFVNPGMHIPDESTRIHHITDDMVKDKPRFEAIAPKIADYLEGCDIAGYNCLRFDIPMLDDEFHRAQMDFDFRNCKIVDVQNIYFAMEPRTLSAAYAFYCNQNHDAAHSADGDTLATLKVFEAQLDKYQGNPQMPAYSIDALAQFTNPKKNVDFTGKFIYNDKGDIMINFGVNKGLVLKDFLRTQRGRSYYDWMMRGDFPEDTKRILKDEMEKVEKAEGKAPATAFGEQLKSALAEHESREHSGNGKPKGGKPGDGSSQPSLF
jgi:DNA polymerase-3 subunit epsilon